MKGELSAEVKGRIAVERRRETNGARARGDL